jgi:hypothetical protein
VVGRTAASVISAPFDVAKGCHHGRSPTTHRQTVCAVSTMPPGDGRRGRCGGSTFPCGGCGPGAARTPGGFDRLSHLPSDHPTTRSLSSSKGPETPRHRAIARWLRQAQPPPVGPPHDKVPELVEGTGTPAAPRDRAVASTGSATSRVTTPGKVPELVEGTGTPAAPRDRAVASTGSATSRGTTPRQGPRARRRDRNHRVSSRRPPSGCRRRTPRASWRRCR